MRWLLHHRKSCPPQGTKQFLAALILETPETFMKRCKIRLGCFAVLLVLQGLFAADFEVTTPNDQSAFRINGVDSPTLTLVRGQTYTFEVATSPGLNLFYIDSPGVVNNDISSGTLTYTVPTNATNYIYFCSVHGLIMAGDIITVEPAGPPTINIVAISVTTNITLTSTGTNTWSVIPEFTTNLVTTNWFALTVQTNRFFNGTNETICGKPPGDEVFIRIRSQPN